EEVGRVAVEEEIDLFAEDFAWSVVTEDEGVEQLVLGILELFGGGWGRLEALCLGEQSFCGGDGVGALGAGFDVEDAGMIVLHAVAASDGIGEAESGADVLHQAGAEAAGEDLIHDGEGIEVGVVAIGAEAEQQD